MRHDEGLRWLYANDPYAQVLTRADYRRRFGILSTGGERQAFSAKVAAKPAGPSFPRVDHSLWPLEWREQDRELRAGIRGAWLIAFGDKTRAGG